jgi:hypothetical protein
VYNYARVVFKHFAIGRALTLAGRVLVGHLASGVSVHGPAVVPALMLNTLRGAVAGRQRYSPLPEAALRFYRNPALLPDFGNVPLWRKALARLRRACGRRDSGRCPV